MNSSVQSGMTLRRNLALALLVALLTPGLRAADDAAETRRLFDLLELKPGMTVAEIGGGSGAMTVEMAKRLGPEGRVYSSELSEKSRTDIRNAAKLAEVENVTVLESGQATANLPAGCCDAIFMRNVYHHFTQPAEMDGSLVAALKPGGRMAIIDFTPDAGSKVPEGVPANRGGHGVPPKVVIDELSSAGLTSVGSRVGWPDESKTEGHGFLVILRKPSS